MARTAPSRNRRQRTTPRRQPAERRPGDIISLVATATREIQEAAQRGKMTPALRTKFQAAASLLRQERARLQASPSPGRQSAEQLKRLDTLAAGLARSAVQDIDLYTLLSQDAPLSEAATRLRRSMLESIGAADETPTLVETPQPEPRQQPAQQRVIPRSVISQQLANPFLAPDFSAAPAAPAAAPRRLARWQLLEPLFTSFERASGAGPACMPLPDTARNTRAKDELMPHQRQLVAAAAAGHRTFLLADEPGLGKTAQALLAADAADAYPLLVVVPNVVKTNWAREARRWTPHRSVTVVHGNGESLDGFADIVVINYEVLDRHVGWLGEFRLRGMVVDEAHFIKHRSSRRSQNVLSLSAQIRARTPRPLLMALTGTPLINDIKDFQAIWQFLGWIDETRPVGELMQALEATGLTPADPGFSEAARRCVIECGIVRRRKVDVAADIPARRIADIPVELEGAAGRSLLAAEQALVQRMLAQYLSVAAADAPIDETLVRRIARSELKDTSKADGENVFSMMRRIGQAKSGLAADFAGQLARSAGKVVFFARHVSVMDAAEEAFERQGIGYTSIRGDQSPSVRQQSIDAFVNDPQVSIAVCSLTAAGVGLNLQVASNLVLGELSWTDAEQTQAIDRSHRIGQTEPVTAWRIIAAQTIDARIAELIDSKAGLADRALDGADEPAGPAVDVRQEALVTLLTEALAES